MKKIGLFRSICVVLLFIAAQNTIVFSQTTEFSYQGFLSDNSASANGSFDFEFRLFENLNGGIALATQARPNVTVTNGVFSVVLDFGAFSPANRFLEIGVRPAGGGSFTTLAPRSKLLSVPYATAAINAQNAQNATNAANATTASNALQLGNVPSGQYVLTTDARLSDARNPLPNSANYIQNRTTQQTSANFNINGDGTVGGTLTGNIVSAGQYNFGSGRILGKFGQNNLYVGTLTGAANGGIQNTFVGDGAGRDNTGNENAFFGFVAAQTGTSGSNNSFFGSRAGFANTTGSNNTLIGFRADVGVNNLTNAAAIGNRSFVEASNSLVLGGVNGKNGATEDTNVGIGTTAPEVPLDVASQLAGSANFRITNFGGRTVFRTRNSGGTRLNPTATQLNDILFEMQADGYTGSAFTAQGRAKILIRATQDWSSTGNGTAIDFFTTPNNTTGSLQRMVITNDGRVGIGRSVVDAQLDVNGDVRVGLTGGTTGCIEDRNGTVIAGVCSSDFRFKKNITPFGSLLNNFSKLRPVNYFWRAGEFGEKRFGNQQSYGLIAQEVEEIFPDLVSTDEKGFKAINYSKLPLLTIQAVKELKAENDLLKQQLQQQQGLINGLRNVVCQNNPQAEVCK